MKSLSLEGINRAGIGTKEANLLRKSGSIPCNLYGGAGNISFSAPYGAFQHIVYSPDFFTVKVNVGGVEFNTVIKEIQFHPVTDRILHIDFLELVPGKKIVVDIPVELTGQAEGVKDGGKLIHKLRKLTVKVAPENLVEKIQLNVEALKLGKSIKVKDLETKDIEVLNSPNIPIASVEIPRAVKIEEPGAAAKPAAGAAAPAADAKAAPAAAAGAKAAEPAKKK